MKVFRVATALGAVVAAVYALTGCSGGGTVNPPASVTNNAMGTQTGQSAVVDTYNSAADTDLEHDTGTSDLQQLDDMKTIGSTVDPVNGDQNPYGLDIAKATSGKLDSGDLVVCNFNNAANVQGTGTTIIALHPKVGSAPRRIAQSASLNGCDALALSPISIWAAAFAANDNPIVSPGGTVLTTLSNGPFHGPFGQAFAPHAGPFGVAAFYESNAGDGSIVRINILKNGTFDFDVIATGFPVNHGVPGAILGPSGLQYDAAHDRLYIVDGTDNSLIAFCGVSTIPSHGITVIGNNFGGPFGHRAHLIHAGPPLNGPISSALLPDGHLVVGNTLDPAGKNLMVEIAPSGHVLNVKNVDTGAAGAIFGMVASGHDISDLKLYFNDDNANAVEVLSK